MRCRVFRGLAAVIPVAILAASALSAGTAFVEGQPLVAQAHRVAESLRILGHPLPAGSEALIRRAAGRPDSREAVKLIRRALDAYCLAVVKVAADGTTAVSRGSVAAELDEQGWRSFLVRVENGAGAVGALRVSSPSARDIPNGPATEVKLRWLGLDVVTSRPMLPQLSGLPLEYRILQVYSRGAGARTARLDFNVGGIPRPGQPARSLHVRTWKFPRDLSSWRAMNQCRLSNRSGAMRVEGLGVDPYLGTDVAAPGGRLVLRFQARFERVGFGQLFWWTEARPRPDGARQVVFQALEGSGGFRDYAIPFEVESDLRGIRIDPMGTPSWAELKEISLYHEDDPGPNTAALSVRFVTRPSTPVRLSLRDELGKPATVCLDIRDEQGRVFPSQTKRLAPDFFFQTQVYRTDGETLKLPAGRYRVVCSRGPESIPETRELIVGRQPVRFDYQVRRWIDPSRSGWWSGDHHIHAAGCQHYTSPTEGVLPRDMARHIRGEDLKVGAALTWGPCFDYQKQFFKGKPDSVSTYPYLLRYDVEVSGFGSHQSGHLCLLRLREQIPPGGSSKEHWPTLGLNTLRWAKRQGAICGPAHSGIGLGGGVGRVAATDGPGGLPSYVIPNYDGIGANEYVVDVTHEVPGPSGRPVPAVDFISTMNTDRTAELNMWYHTLNCGYRVRASGETDFPCISGERVGLGRVYVRQRGKLTYDDWCEGIREGRSYVSDGRHHLMDFAAVAAASESVGARRVAVGEGGSEMRLAGPSGIRVSVEAAARSIDGSGTVPVEVVVNGYPIPLADLAMDGRTRRLEREIRVERSSWIAIRVRGRAHTNPIFLLVGDRPIRASRRSAEWCLRGVEQCWMQKERTYAQPEMADARVAYEHARAEYRRIRAECEVD